MKATRGFTLVELLVTLMVVGILLVVGVPSLETLIKNNRLTAATNALATALTLARSEAVRRGQTATLCVSSDLSSCAASSTDWEDGWLVWSDANGDGVLDSAEIVSAQEALPSNISVTATSGNIQFDGTGLLTSTPATFTLCDDRSGNYGRQLRVLAGGSVSLTTEVNCP